MGQTIKVHRSSLTGERMEEIMLMMKPRIRPYQSASWGGHRSKHSRIYELETALKQVQDHLPRMALEETCRRVGFQHGRLLDVLLNRVTDLEAQIEKLCGLLHSYAGGNFSKDDLGLGAAKIAGRPGDNGVQMPRFYRWWPEAKRKLRASTAFARVKKRG
jgi:hypothetical protein